MSHSQDPFDDLPEAPVGEVQGEEHISFVQRLEGHFGQSVDPEIDLHEGEYDSDSDADSGATDDPEVKESSSPSNSSRDLLRKLSQSIQLGSRFKIKREIARGGMGIIFRVWDQDLRRNLAMKVMHSDSGLDVSRRPEDFNQEKLGRFLEEAQITGQLDHPGIVPVHDLGIDAKGRCYFTMRLVRGRELKEVLDLMREGKEHWTQTKVLSLILKICESMAFAHSKGVVHRDLKPQNVMVGRFGEVYVMDWGLARVLGRRDSHDIRLRPEVDEPSSLSLVHTVRKEDSEANPDSSLVTMDGDVVGTPSFMAVEQAQGKLDQVGVRSDVYSLGAILYYMLTGRSPYVTPGERASPHTILNRVLQAPPEPVSDFVQDQPAELVAICEKAMHRDADQRYSSMLAVAEDIQAYLEDRVVGAYEGGSFAEARKWISRNRGMAMVSAATIVLALASAVGFAVMKQVQISDLEDKEKEIQAIAEDALESEKKANEKSVEADLERDQAKKNLDKAEKSAEEARLNEELAKRGAYNSTIVAADFSLRSDDLVEAKNQLSSSNNLFRDWEHAHLDLRTREAIENIDLLKRELTQTASNERRAVKFLEPSGDSIERHWAQIDQVAWTPTGDLVALMTRDGLVRFMAPSAQAEAQGADLKLKYTSSLQWTSGFVPDMSFNRDGSRAALVGFDHRVHVFDTDQRIPLMSLPLLGDGGHNGRVSQVSYCKLNGNLVTGSDTGEIMLWDADGSRIERTVREGFSVTSLAWGPAGKYMAAGFADGKLYVWEVKLLKFPIHRLEGHVGPVNGLAFSHDGTQIFSAGEDGRLNTWMSRQGRLVSSYRAHRKALTALDYDSNSRRVVTASSDQTLRIWNMESGESRVLLGHEAGVRSVAFSADGRFILSSDVEGETKTWDASAEGSFTDLTPMPADLRAVAFGPQGKFLATGDAAGNLLLWDAESGHLSARLRGHESQKAITALIFDGDGSHLFSASEDSFVRRWNTKTGRQSAVYKHPDAVSGLALSEGANGEQALFTSSGKSVYCFDIRTRQLLNEFVAGPRKLTGLQMHPDGELVGCTDSTRLIFWDVNGMSEVRSFRLLGSLGTFAFSPDGKQVLGSTHEGKIEGWELESTRGLPLELDSMSGTGALAFHPNSKRFASGNRDGSLRIWDADSLDVLLTLNWQDEEVKTLAFDRDGTRLIAGSKSGAIRIWETALVSDRRKRRYEEGQLRAAQQPEVDRLFNEHLYVSDVLGALEEDSGLSPEALTAAILLANLRGPDSVLHAASSLEVALVAGHSEEVYSQALRQAEVALEISNAPHRPAVLLALGAASYRAGEIDQASTWLGETHARLQELQRGPESLGGDAELEQALILKLFQCLACRSRGKLDSAQTFFTEAQATIKKAGGASFSEELLDLWDEVESE